MIFSSPGWGGGHQFSPLWSFSVFLSMLCCLKDVTMCSPYLGDMITSQIILNSSALDICLRHPIYLVIYSMFIYISIDSQIVVLYVGNKSILHYLFCYSNCPTLTIRNCLSWFLSLCCMPSFFFFLFSFCTFLLFGTTSLSRFILYIYIFTLAHFSKASWFLSVENGFRNKDLRLSVLTATGTSLLLDQSVCVY